MIGGLLGQSWDDPKTMGLLQLAASLQGSPKVMQGLAQGLMGYQGAMQQGKRAKAEEEDRALRRQAQQMQLQQQQAQMLASQGKVNAYRDAFRTPEQMAMAANRGPTMAAAQAAPTTAPGFDQNALLRGLVSSGNVQDAYQMLQPQPADYKVVGDALVQVGPGGVKEAYRPPQKPAAAPANVQEYEYAKQQGYPGSYLDFQLAQKRAGATSVSVNTGPKAFDAELGKYAVDAFGKQRDAAQAAAGVLQSVGEIRRAAAGGAYQGAGADLKLSAAKALGAIGMPYDAKTVANSELFSAQANQFVLNSIKQLGANPSNADREFIEKTVPRLQTDPAALPQLLDFLERKSRAQLQTYNKSAKGVQSRAGYLPIDLEVPEPQAGGEWSIRPVGGGR